MYQTNQNNMMLDFDSLEQTSFISVESVNQRMDISPSIQPNVVDTPRVDVMSMDIPQITPSIQKSAKPHREKNKQLDSANQNLAVTQPPTSQGFDAKLGSNSQLPSKSKSSVPRFGMETQTKEIGTIPEWRRFYM